jgi:hypothetical protein
MERRLDGKMNWNAETAKAMSGLLVFLSVYAMGATSAGKTAPAPKFRGTVQDPIDPLSFMAEFFAEKGFRAGEVTLPELDIRVHLARNRFFKREDGVEDVYARINEIRRLFGLSTPYTDAAAGNGWCGMLSAEFGGREAFAYVVLVKRGLNEASRIYTAAHESGHFLWYIDETKKIIERSRKPDLVNSRIRTNDDFAVMCGWIALKTAGYSLKDCMIIRNRDPDKDRRIERIKGLVDEYFPP